MLESHSQVAEPATQFKNGDNIHFDYNDPSTARVINDNEQTGKKKKRKKSKTKSKAAHSEIHATLNNPDDDYPTSRVIKQAPNGDVVVESLDEHDHDHDHHHDHEHLRHTNIWDSATIEEQENLKLFWESLDEPQKMELVKIDKKSIMEIFKNETRVAANQAHHNNHGPSGTVNNGASVNNGNINNNCTCKYCGRRNNIIEDELENIYDNHFDDIIDFIHEVRDINDLDALPGLLFGGFHMLEEEHKLQKRQQRLKNLEQHEHNYSTIEHNQDHTEQIHEHSKECAHEDHSHDHSHELDQELDHDHSLDHIPSHNESLQSEEVPTIHEAVTSRSIITQPSPSQSQPSLKNDDNHEIDSKMEGELNFDALAQVEDLCKGIEELQFKIPGAEGSSSKLEISDISAVQKLFHKLLDPKLFEALENLDFEKIKDSSSNPNNTTIYQQKLLQKAGSLREMLRDLHNSDKVQLEKGMSFVQNMGKIFTSATANTSNALVPPTVNNGSIDSNSRQILSNKFNDQLNQGLSSFAEDLLKNDGLSFIDMMESLSESRTAREDLLRENPAKREPLPAWTDEDDIETAEISQKILNNANFQPSNVYPNHENEEEVLEQIGGNQLEEEEDEIIIDYDDEAEEDDDDEVEDDGEVEAEAEGGSDTESEISEEEKMQEIRRLFLIQVIKLFQERLKNAYKEKLSEDRTQKLIEELEAEENAKKERELKKLKQKEKAKEKKRLQQLEKEEERKKKEEELKEKEEVLKQKQEALKADQKRRKEEAKLKREEEKKKRIEEIKRKEEEHKKKVEAQRKKEDESKKLKEERKKKVEEERKRKEEERRQKDFVKKQRDDEREHQRLQKQNEELVDRARREQFEQELLARSAAEIAERAVSSTIGEDITTSPSKSPTKNHILEQLYQARPGSMSNQSGTPGLSSQYLSSNDNLNQGGFIPSLLSPGPVSILPSTVPLMNNNVSPNTHNSLLYGTGGNYPNTLGGTNMSPWGSKSRLNSASNPSTFPTQFNNNGFSPFNGFGSENINPIGVADPFQGTNMNAPPDPFQVNLGSTDPFQASNNPPPPVAGAASNVWNPPAAPRNNSIWGRNPSLGANNTSTLWGNVGHVGSIPNANINNGPGMVNMTNNMTNSGTNPNMAHGSMDNEIIQAAAYNGYQMLQNTNQLDFGVAPLLKLFLTTKTILGDTTISINQFLGAFRNSQTYQFDFIYDDYGTVTHIKAGLKDFNTAPETNPANIANTSGLLGPRPDASLLKSFGTGMDNFSNSNIAPNGRGLWN